LNKPVNEIDRWPDDRKSKNGQLIQRVPDAVAPNSRTYPNNARKKQKQQPISANAWAAAAWVHGRFFHSNAPIKICLSEIREKAYQFLNLLN
jgi:hypothetical protein